MIRVLLADDHPIVLRGLRQFVDAQPGLRVVAEASTAEEVMRVIPAENAHVAVLDLSLPGGGVDLVQRVCLAFPAVSVIVFSVYPENALAVHLLQVGARAYLSKDRSTEELARAIRKVAAGGRYITDRLEDLSAEMSSKKAELPPHEHLSAREHQVFMLLIQGRSVGDIAAELELAASTVSNNIAKIREKLGVNSVGEILLYAHRVGLLG